MSIRKKTVAKKAARTEKAATAKQSDGQLTSASTATSGSSSRNHGYKEVLVLIPWDLTRPYFNRLCNHCENQLMGIDGLRPIIRSLYRDPDGSNIDVLTVLKREITWTSPEQIASIVVAPTGDRELERQVARFCKQNQQLPAIALSLPFHFPDEFTKLGLEQPLVAWADGKDACRDLGQKAAERFLNRRRVPSELNLLLIPGSKGRQDSAERIEGFTAGLRQTLNSGQHPVRPINTVTTADCEWQDEKARDAVLAHLASKRSAPHIVFAASDRMALGAEHALSESPKTNHQVIDLYGFDFIEQVEKRLQDSTERFFRGSVRQGTEEIADGLCEIIKRLMDPKLNGESWEPLQAGATPKYWCRFDEHSDEFVVPPFHEHEANLWCSEDEAKREDKGKRAKSLTQLRNEDRYKDKDGRERIGPEKDEYGMFVVDIDGRMARQVKRAEESGKARWMYLKETLVDVAD